MCKFSPSSRAKLGNTIIYIAKHAEHPSKTKVLKLLYLMEERMALQYHVPFLAIPFEVWQAGPVAKDVFVDLSDGPVLLHGYIETTTEANGTYVKAAREFDDSEFSDAELKMMADVVKHYGAMTATELVHTLHKPGTLWREAAQEAGLYTAFQNNECNSSDVCIDFTRAMAGCAAEQYRESLDVRQTANILCVEANV